MRMDERMNVRLSRDARDGVAPRRFETCVRDARRRDARPSDSGATRETREKD